MKTKSLSILMAQYSSDLYQKKLTSFSKSAFWDSRILFVRAMSSFRAVVAFNFSWVSLSLWVFFSRASSAARALLSASFFSMVSSLTLLFWSTEVLFCFERTDNLSSAALARDLPEKKSLVAH